MKSAGIPVIVHSRSVNPASITLQALNGRIYPIAFQKDSGNTPIDFLLVTTKANDTLSALNPLKSRLNPSSVVVLLQNGVLGVYDELKYLFPSYDQGGPLFILGSCSHGVLRTSSTSFVHTGTGSIFLGCAQSLKLNPEQLNYVKLLMSIPELNVQFLSDHDQLQKQLLQKLIVNACINPLASIYDIQNGYLDLEEGRTLIREIVNECLMILKHPCFSHDQMTEYVLDVARKTSKNYNSMLMDLKHSRATEVEYILGYLLKEAKQLHVSCPKLQFLYHGVLFKQSLMKQMHSTSMTQ